MKDIARAMRHNESSIEKSRPTSLDIVTSANGGKYANVKTLEGAEYREVKILNPYGIASSVSDGMRVQTIINQDGSTSIVGVSHSDRPDVNPGDTIIYDTFGDRIILNESGISISSPRAIRLNGSTISISGDTITINGYAISKSFINGIKETADDALSIGNDALDIGNEALTKATAALTKGTYNMVIDGATKSVQIL